MDGGRRNVVLSVVAGVLAVSGLTAVALAVTGQVQPSQPPAAAESAGPPLTAPADTSNALAPSAPLSISIPAIGVSSELQYLGLNPDNTLEVPAPGPLYDVASWYKYSTPPGSVGAAVIIGHVDSLTGGPSVFFDLGALRPFDRILVHRADGQTAIFQVDTVRSYSKRDFPEQLVYGATEHASLRLITCGGPFDVVAGGYLENIVVFASLVDSA